MTTENDGKLVGWTALICLSAWFGVAVCVQHFDAWVEEVTVDAAQSLPMAQADSPAAEK
jgi:hypothetical protein